MSEDTETLISYYENVREIICTCICENKVDDIEPALNAYARYTGMPVLAEEKVEGGSSLSVSLDLDDTKLKEKLKKWQAFLEDINNDVLGH